MSIHNPSELLDSTTKIVCAAIANGAYMGSVSDLIQATYRTLQDTTAPARPSAAAPEPAVPVRSSVKPDYLVCLEDGAKLKMLKRYLRTHYSMTPEEYRAKWGLPRDYPMVAPAYAEKRRDIAKTNGLGRKSGPAAAKRRRKAA